MSDSNTISTQERPIHQARILPFMKRPHKGQFQACFFCGKTIRTQVFKGKTVCLHCLHQIPSIFSYG